MIDQNEKEFLERMVKYGHENECLDFKSIQYVNDENLIKDIMAMANSKSDIVKYIIVGVKVSASGERIIIGISPEDFKDSAEYYQFVLNNIEPDIEFDYFRFDYDNKILGIFKISPCYDRPYIMSKDFKRLKRGFCYIRKGSQQSHACRKDFDEFYYAKEKFSISLKENMLAAAYPNDGCARIKAIIRNHTRLPVTIEHGYLEILDDNGQKLTHHQVYGIDRNIVGADFKLPVKSMEEILCDLYVGFTSTDSLRLNLNDDGYTDQVFRFKLAFITADDKEYIDVKDKCIVYAKGDFLWKVRLRK